MSEMLEKPLSLLFFIFFFFFLHFTQSLSNPDSATLLAFKSSVLDPSNSLSSWTNSTDLCSGSWLGVTCSSSTLRVTRLVLEDLNLTGSILPLIQLTELRLLSLKYNHLSSTSNFSFSSWAALKHLYLSHNRLVGKFPPGLGNLQRLRRLDVSYNYFSGEIPMTELAQLSHLLTLRLEANSFSGTISSARRLPSSVLDLNISYNYLSGKIPSSLSRFPASSFSGNQNLCGEPLLNACYSGMVESDPAQSSKPVTSTKKRLNNWVLIIIVSVIAMAIVSGLMTITCYCFRERRRKRGSSGDLAKRKATGSQPPIGGYYVEGRISREGKKMVLFEGCHGFSKVNELLSSSAELLGKGTVGTTYKVLMDGDGVLVVKRVRERRKRRELDGWLKVIGGLRHSNVVSLRAYYQSKDELLLVYDFLPNGSLQSLLHGNRGPGRTPLEWAARLRIASGSAKGLAFLHSYDKAKLFHGNLTSSNIIVDRSGNACISDIGLHQLVHAPSFSNNAYKAPELLPNDIKNHDNVNQRKFSQKCDVYSFGVVLLELLTGKMPNGEGNTSLVKWVQGVGREEWAWEVFDFELFGCKQMEEQMVALMQVALLCVSELPRDRPKMSIVHRMIEDISSKGATEVGPNSIMNDLTSDSSPSLSENAS
ncbi:hypothetical protein K2173_015749 [Erythroxylum novogranatense]|uniref:Protein kinase domain-containing protein n=1 Tax=Erythroxylum novogranatense TaxID=1862640 RepID=A0AAV8SED7_9ROSI|nr:hypothetical protein K2173_015749 [Erythroxylum novogranatense]